MPIFLRNTSEAVYVEPGRVVFHRGERQNVATNRRLRDTLCLMCAGLGMSPADIAAVMRGVTGRRIRQVLPLGSTSTEAMLRGIAQEILDSKRKKEPPMAKSKRYVSEGAGRYAAKTTEQVADDLRNQGFAPGLASQIAEDHERVATSGAKKLMKPERQPKIPTSVNWGLPNSGSKI